MWSEKRHHLVILAGRMPALPGRAAETNNVIPLIVLEKPPPSN